MNAILKKQIKELPTKPGIYIYRNAEEKILYVGKAKILRSRVRSYFRASVKHSLKNQALVARIDHLETIVTASELEALILESNLIKRHRPRYNILLRDDKTYPYLKLTLDEAYPRLLVSRRPHEDQSRYYGPYVHVAAMRETMRLIHKFLKIRQCNIDIDRRRPRACIYYEMKQCDAPCVAWGESREQYQEHVRQARQLLEGKENNLLKNLNVKMEDASAQERYEDAGTCRDSIKAIQKMQLRQRVVLSQPKNLDVLTLARNEQGELCAQVYFVRGGKLVDRQTCCLSNMEKAAPGDALEAFIIQYYDSGAWVPDEVVIAAPFEAMKVMAQWLGRKKGSKVLLTAPRRGSKHALVKLVEENASGLAKDTFGEDNGLNLKKIPAHDRQGALLELQELFQLPVLPRRIEGFDISHVQGTHTVASMVVLEDGYSKNKDYRRYKIKTVKGIDDFASMKEVVGRRYKRLLDEKHPLPDLVLIDGGKGQLSAAMEALKKINLDHLPVFGLAKRLEEIFVPGRSQSYRLAERSAGRLMLQRLRDEAHRFALAYHRQLRSKAIRHSELDNVAGVGPAMKKRLLEAFGSLEALRKADESALVAVAGVGSSLAARIQQRLKADA